MTTPKIKPGEIDNILKKYPEKIPVFITKLKDSRDNLPNISKNKFLVPRDLEFSQFIYTIRRYLRIRPETAIILFVNGQIPRASATFMEIYHSFKSPDGLLKISYTSENTFGN